MLLLMTVIIVMAAAGNQCANTAPKMFFLGNYAQSACQGLSCQNGLCKERLFKLVAHAGATRVKADRVNPLLLTSILILCRNLLQSYGVFPPQEVSFNMCSTDPSGFNDRPSKHHISVRVIEALIASQSALGST